MPGFNIAGRGGDIGIAGGPLNTSETRRKHRWVFSTVSIGSGNALPSNILLFLQSAQRPHVVFEEPEMHHNQEKAWFAGKHAWEAITLAWYDAENPADVSEAIWHWYNIVMAGDNMTANVSRPDEYKANSTLKMLDGRGNASESWLMYGCWPKDINWSDLDYTNTEIQKIECTMRFDRAQRVA